jgi:hypothetical protein
MTKISLAYPKIPDSKNCPFKQCIAFEKYDGTNLHWVWEQELGWYAFGTRHNRFDLDEMGIAEFNSAHPGLEEASGIFLKDFAEPLDKMFRENSDYDCPEITVFTEFFGANSFAGMHDCQDSKQLILLDIERDQDIIDPDRFVRDFQHLPIARTIYRGKLTGKFIENVRNSKYDVAEGVICKGRNRDGTVWMVKIKTNSYLEKLKQTFQDNWHNYWE